MSSKRSARVRRRPGVSLSRPRPSRALRASFAAALISAPAAISSGRRRDDRKRDGLDCSFFGGCMSPVLAPLRHADGRRECPELGADRKRQAHSQSDAIDPKLTSAAKLNDALPGVCQYGHLQRHDIPWLVGAGGWLDIARYRRRCFTNRGPPSGAAASVHGSTNKRSVRPARQERRKHIRHRVRSG
jgi:hypothetical protein